MNHKLETKIEMYEKINILNVLKALKNQQEK